MIVYNPVINVALLGVLAVVLFVFTGVTYWQVASRLSLPKRALLLFWRLAACTLLLLILLQPSIQENNPFQKEQAVIGLAVDTSKSMLQADVAGQKRIDYAVNQALNETAAGEIPLKFFSFDKTARVIGKEQLEKLSAEGNDTRIHDSLNKILNAEAGYGMQSLVLLTDGHDFQFEALEETARLAMSKHCRLFALPIGNKGKVRDVYVLLTSSQDTIFKGNKVQLTAHVRAQSCEFEKVNLKLMRNGEVIDNRVVALEDKAEHTITFESLEEHAGIAEFSIEVSRLDAEVDYENNHYVLYVKCIDENIRALYLEGEPHWESSFLRRFLAKAKMVHLDAFFRYQEGKLSSQLFDASAKLPESKEDFAKYDIILLGRGVDRLLSESALNLLVEYVKESGGAVIFTRGNAFDGELGRQLQPVDWDESGYEKVVLKTTSEGRKLSLLRQLDELVGAASDTQIPPLDISRKVALKKPFTQYLALAEDDYRDSTHALAYRRLGRGQALSLGAEGLWHWRFNQAYDPEADYYASFWNQIIIWLIHNGEFIPGQAYTFRHDSSNINLGDQVNFRFSVRNENDIAKSQPKVLIKSSKGNFEVALNAKEDEARHRFVGAFSPPSEGKYDVSLIDPDGREHSLKFLVTQSSLEEKEVGVDPEYLSVLCQLTGGRLITEKELGSLDKLTGLKKEETIKDRIQLKPVWDKVWLMWMSVMFLGFDWFFRRKWGLC